MKLIVSLLLLLCITLPASAQKGGDAGHFSVPSVDVGTTVSLNGKWHFTPSTSSDAKSVVVPVPQMLSRIQWWLDDSEDFKKWEQKRLDTLGFETEKTDQGTYRITFDVPKDWPKDGHLWVEFDGVAMKCKTSCDGKPLGEHKGMFSRFSYDLTEHLKPGEANELSVWVSMEKIPETEGDLGQAVTVNLSAAKVISMSKGMFGPFTAGENNRAYDLYGIWQPVKLVVRGPARINDVFFQPTESLDGARVDVEVQSHGYMGKTTVRAKWLDPDPKVLERFELSQTADLAGMAHVTLSGTGFKPKPWTPAQPNLYRLEVTVEKPDGTVLDKWTQKVGFRTFRVYGNQLLLNDHPYWLRGANQLPYGKNPWDPDQPRKLIQFLHDGNIRATRTHATPWNENWLDAADEIGLAVSIEGIRPWAFAGRTEGGKTVMPPKEIFEHWLMENQDVVKRCRNHPSVFMFTVGNEMLLRDSKSLEKWKLLSDVTRQTRAFAPGFPIVVSSDYVRDPDFYEKTLKLAGIDDGDIDDMHRYNGWYSGSPFVVSSEKDKERVANANRRPLVGQEMSSGYPDLDTGLPVLRYTRDLLTPQAWVGVYAYPGNDPAIWLEHHAAVTKRWAEQLRYERGASTSGFSLFSAECWFRHSYLTEAEPYPVYRGVKQAFAPVGIALKTTQRRFYQGDKISSDVLITNDDEQFRDLSNLAIQCELGTDEGESFALTEPKSIGAIKYYWTHSESISVPIPQLDRERVKAMLTIRLLQGGKEISRTSDTVELFRKPKGALDRPDNVIVISHGASLDDAQRQKIESGETAIWFSPGKQILQLLKNDLLDIKNDPQRDIAEFADWTPARGTRLVEKLQPMDLKWWARKGDERAFIASSSHRLNPKGRGRELIRFIPPHSYISSEKVPDQYRVVLSEIPLGKGRVWICDLDADASAETDPAARIFAENLYAAAADPDSTKNLKPMPTHEEMLRGVKP